MLCRLLIVGFVRREGEFHSGGNKGADVFRQSKMFRYFFRLLSGNGRLLSVIFNARNILTGGSDRFGSSDDT